MPYLKVADEFSKNIRKYGDGKQSVPELGQLHLKRIAVWKAGQKLRHLRQ